MVRGKIEMKRIENATSRQVSFSKRRHGLIKKAYELSLLCDAQLSLIIFSPNGRLYEFSSSNTEKTIERYREYVKEQGTTQSDTDQRYIEQLKNEIANMAKKIECLEISLRKLTGKNLGSCSIEELLSLDSLVESSLRKIRAKKTQLFQEEIERLKAKEMNLSQENAKLRDKSGGMKQCSTIPIKERENGYQNSEVDTQLFIGLPSQIGL